MPGAWPISCVVVRSLRARVLPLQVHTATGTRGSGHSILAATQLSKQQPVPCAQRPRTRAGRALVTLSISQGSPRPQTVPATPQLGQRVIVEDVWGRERRGGGELNVAFPARRQLFLRIIRESVSNTGAGRAAHTCTHMHIHAHRHTCARSALGIQGPACVRNAEERTRRCRGRWLSVLSSHVRGRHLGRPRA